MSVDSITNQLPLQLKRQEIREKPRLHFHILEEQKNGTDMACLFYAIKRLSSALIIKTRDDNLHVDSSPPTSELPQSCGKSSGQAVSVI